MKSSERTLQAMKWLVELETKQHLEDIWPAFDAWFQASAANRKEYKRVKKALLHRGTLIVTDRCGPRTCKSDRPEQGLWGRPFALDREMFLIVAALLALTICLTQL